MGLIPKTRLYIFFLVLSLFLNDKYIVFRNKKCIAITDKHAVYRKIPHSPFNIQRLTHYKCGGATNFICLYGATFWLDPVYSTLQRTIGDYIDHSIIPWNSPSGFSKPISSYLRLPVNHSETLIQYPTPRVASGWGFRNLSSDELGLILDFRMF